MADLKFKVHDHTTQVFLNGFCLFLPRHLVISVCLLAVHCGKPLVTSSHVANEDTAQYNYSATVRMSCDDGCIWVEGSYALRCLANGRWNDTSLRCKRKWSSGVRYHSVRFCVFLFFFGLNLIQKQIRLLAANYFHFSPVETKCLWQEARVHEARQASNDKRTRPSRWHRNCSQTSTRKRAIICNSFWKGEHLLG